MRKILIINTVGFRWEGISSVILNYTSNMNREELEIEFAVNDNAPDSIKEVLQGYGRVQEVPFRKGDAKSYLKALNQLLKKEKYDVIHVHGNSGTMLLEVISAKLHGINNIIVHCHNTTCNHPVINHLFRVPMMILSDYLLSCSTESGKWLYGNREHIVLNNAINLDRLAYQEDVREEYRKEFGLKKEEIVIGHVGTFSEQKNHEFLLDVFAEVVKKQKNVKLMLISDGRKFEEMKQKAKALNISDSVLFLGRRTDAYKLYSAMDVFVLPSRWEGLPLVLLEAQANGLPAVVSANVTEEAKCTERVQYISLEKGPKYWADKIMHIIENDDKEERKKDQKHRLAAKKFDIKTEADVLRKIYLEK